MSREHLGAAVVVAGLLTASPIALGEVEDESHARTEISGCGGWEQFRAPVGALVVDSNEVADGNGADARKTRSSPLENDPVYAIIPPTTRSTIISDDSPAVDPFKTTFGSGNSNNIGTFGNKSAHASVSTPTGSSRAVTSVSYAKSTLPPAGCARCVGQVARASTGEIVRRLVLKEFFRKGGAVLPRHLVSGIVRQRNPPLLAASTIQRSWLNPCFEIERRSSLAPSCPDRWYDRFVSTPL